MTGLIGARYISFFFFLKKNTSMMTRKTIEARARDTGRNQACEKQQNQNKQEAPSPSYLRAFCFRTALSSSILASASFTASWTDTPVPHMA